MAKINSERDGDSDVRAERRRLRKQIRILGGLEEQKKAARTEVGRIKINKKISNVLMGLPADVSEEKVDQKMRNDVIRNLKMTSGLLERKLFELLIDEELLDDPSSIKRLKLPHAGIDVDLLCEAENFRGLGDPAHLTDEEREKLAEADRQIAEVRRQLSRQQLDQVLDLIPDDEVELAD